MQCEVCSRHRSCTSAIVQTLGCVSLTRGWSGLRYYLASTRTPFCVIVNLMGVEEAVLIYVPENCIISMSVDESAVLGKHI